MSTQYKHYTNVTKEILDTVKAGDLIKINDWKKPMRVKAVSENFLVMTQKNFRNTYYSVCSKLPQNGTIYNNMRGSMFHCGPDDWIFGSPLCAKYDNLYEFEKGQVHISERSGIAIYDLYVKCKE